MGFGKGVWQLIPQFPGFWLHVLSDACLLLFPSPPSGCCVEPTGFVGGCGVGAKSWITVCVQGVFWRLAGLAEGVWVSLHGGRHTRSRPRV